MVDVGARRRTDPNLRRLLVATASVAAGLAFAVPATALSWQVSRHSSLAVPLQAFGVACILIGYVAWIRLPESRTGPLIVFLGTTYYLRDLRASSNVAIFGVGICLAYVWTAVVAHLALAWPTGRVTGRANRALLLCCYAAAVITQTLRLIIDHPHRPRQYGTPFERTPASRAGSISVVVFALVVVVVTVRRWRAASGIRRRWRAPVWAALLLVAIPSIAASLASLVVTPVRVADALLLAALGTSVLLVPVVLVAQSTTTMRARWRLARVVLDRDRASDLKLRPELLQQALAEALGDPALRVAYPLGDGRFVDVDGRQALPAVGATGRAVTELKQAGELVALIEHDEALNERQQVAATVAEVADVAIENARMHARLRAQIEQIGTSRFRVSAAALEERRLIQRNLHDGAQQQFFAVLALLGLARHQLDASAPDEITQARGLVHRAHSQLQNAIESLRDLTQGIYPTALTEQGLAAAIEGIADTSPVPIVVDIPGTRWPEHVETTAYFLIAEAITNAYRHAQATQVIVHVSELDGWVRVEVSDDGRGGATFRPGRGPGGMLDRVNTIGGSLAIRSEPGEGTTILAKLPVEMLIS
jgi:signal transduction histidine kinase